MQLDDVGASSPSSRGVGSLQAARVRRSSAPCPPRAVRATPVSTPVGKGAPICIPREDPDTGSRRLNAALHLVWGYVSLTGIAAAVSPGFHPLQNGRDSPTPSPSRGPREPASLHFVTLGRR